MNRLGENGETPTRNSRFFQKDTYWYYTTREGIDIGPFDSEQDAHSGVSAFIDFVTHADPQTVSSLAKYASAA